MTDLTFLCDEVIAKLCDTAEYKEYMSLLSRIKEDAGLYERLTEFREKNFMLQQSDSEDLFDMLDALTNEYEDVINIELASDFFEAEAAFCKMIQDFNYKLVEGLKFE